VACARSVPYFQRAKANAASGTSGCTDQYCAHRAAPAASDGFPSPSLRCAKRWTQTLGSVTTGAIRCGIPSYKFNSSRFGSTSTIFTSSGVALYRMDIIRELMKTPLARSRRTRNQQVRHRSQIRHANPPVQIAAHRQRQLARGAHKLLRFQNLPERNRLPVDVRHFNANRGFSRNAFDQNRFRLQR